VGTDMAVLDCQAAIAVIGKHSAAHVLLQLS
jgi:hypothetical protein